MSGRPDWLDEGQGTAPTLLWTAAADAPIVATAVARESGMTFAADESGSLYLIGRTGQIESVSRGFPEADRIAWSDTGSQGAVVTRGEDVSRIDASFETLWATTMPGEVLAIALDPFGHHLAVSLHNRRTLILNWKNKRVADFETTRPLCFLRFCATEPLLIGAANHGHLCCHDLKGDEVWNERMFSNVGDLRITGDAARILIAGYNHGVQLFDGEGTHQGSYMVEGTPKLADCTYTPENLAVATIEHQLYWLDADGEMKWSTETEEEISGLHCDPLGGAMTVAMSGGRVHRLSWNPSE